MEHWTFSCSIGLGASEQNPIDPGYFSERLMTSWPGATIRPGQPEGPMLFRGRIPVGAFSVQYAFSRSLEALLLEDGDAAANAEIALWFRTFFPSDARLIMHDDHGLDEIELKQDT